MATTPVFLPGTFHGQRSLVGYSPQGHKKQNMTEGLSIQGLLGSQVTYLFAVFTRHFLLRSYIENIRHKWCQHILRSKGNLFISTAVCQLLNCVQLFVTPQTVSHQAPLSMEFFRQEYWSGLPFPSPGDLSNPGIYLRSPALQVFFTI